MPPEENDDYYEQISELETTEIRMKIMNRPPPPIPTVPIIREPMIQTPVDHRSNYSNNEDFVFLFKPQTKTLKKVQKSDSKLLLVLVFVISFLCVSTLITLLSWIFIINHGVCWNSGFETDMHNSSVYYECSGIMWERRICEMEGDYFDKKEKICLTMEITDRIIYLTSGTCIEGSARPNSGRKYKRCRGNKWIDEECPIGHVFNYVHRICVESRRDDCETCETTTNVIKPTFGKCIEGTFSHGYEKNRKYEICRGGKWVEEECPIGHTFNHVSGKCLGPTQQCRSGSVLKDGICQVPSCENGTIEKVLDHRQYRVCKNDGFQWVTKNCPDGHVFNNSVDPKRCVPE